MRILQISHNLHVTGGSDAVFFATSELLKRNGHQVVPFCIENEKNHDSTWARYFPKGADTRSKPAFDTLRYFYNMEAQRKLAQLIQDHGPFDAAHLHIYHGKHTPAILPVLRRRRIPVIHTLHEYKLACPVYTMQRGGAPCDLCISGSTANAIKHRCKDGSLARSAIMFAEFHAARLLGDLRNVDRFLCVSGFQRRVMEKAGLPRKKLRVLHNFVEEQPDSAPPTADAPLLYFGRIEKLKGLPTLLAAARDSGRKLVIAGQGAWQNPMYEALKSLPDVQYLGFKSGPDLARLIRQAKAVIVPSEWYENCPMSVLEAKAWGRPVVGARIGGIPELVREGRDGFLFEPGNADDLNRALGKLDQAAPQRLSQNARLDIANRFSASAHLDALLGHYLDVQPQPKLRPLMQASA